MIHTKKKYVKIGNEYIEDVNGYCIGYEWTGGDNVLRRVIYFESVDNLIHKFTNAKSDYQIFDYLSQKWVQANEVVGSATMDSYINTQTGLLENEPFVMETVVIDGVEITQPTTELKPNVMPEFQFLYNLQMQIFENLIQGMQARKFGATSFE